MKQIHSVLFAAVLVGLLLTNAISAQRRISQPPNLPFDGAYWHARLICPGGNIRFGIRFFPAKSGQLVAWILNGSEKIKVHEVVVKENGVKIGFPHYDSRITAMLDRSRQTMKGVWKKAIGTNKASQLEFHASMKSDYSGAKATQGRRFLGRWNVNFSSSEDPAVAVFKANASDAADYMDVRQFSGTFLTTTGDYRFLAGDFIDGKLELSVFDGAHAFLFRADVDKSGKLKGDFWSRDSWHETWIAEADPTASLPDAFQQTRWTGKAQLEGIRFPNLDGKVMSLADKEFAGKVRLITIFGSWCPNCHDSALYLASLHRKYAAHGLSIVGLAFEISGDFKRDAELVRKYRDRHKTPYPLLVAGLADKREASKRLPILDRVRSYPTTIFLNSKNEVISIHTGFSGPATGKAYDQLRARFEAIIEKQLSL